MFFKRLDVHGFKSFGHRTAIDFQEGFTIVVGPNGCGKSNILDAIRWVLGETSPKSLRGGRMSDVVFRGTQSVKPAGLASVTLTLENTAGQLPVDQAEISVTRRLFANGESQYLLNKVPCRMRDIHELFLDTGLGADGYSVIEQGQIGQMVAAKPDERREIFEEAAGISRYKVRREETVRKLKRTEEDLLRLFDLVGEVERQCNSLRYQARKAQRHRRLARRLHRLQQRLIVLRHRKLTSQMGEAKAKQQAARLEYEQAAARGAQADSAVTAKQQELEELQRQVQRLQQESYDLRSRLEREKHRAAMCTQQITTIDDRVQAIDKELESREARLTVLKATIGALEKDLREEDSRRGECQAELEAKSNALGQARQAFDEAQQAIQRLRGELNELKARENTLTNDKRLAETLAERLHDDMEATSFQHKELQEAIETVERELAEHQSRLEKAQARIAELQEEKTRLLESIGRDDRTQSELTERLDSLTRDLNQATSRMQALQELEDNYEGYYRGVREVMIASGRSELQGVVGVVSSLLNVPSHLEVAVEVALGSDLQDIVMERVEDAKLAIGYLKRKSLGRATFLPLDFLHTDFRVDHLQPLWGREGVLGLARDLIGHDAKIATAVQYLFGNTVFVEDLDVAVQIERDGIRNRFVSLQGDVVNPRGVLSGGSVQTRGLLSRQREIRQLKDHIGELEQELRRLSEELQATKDRLGSLQARSAEVQAEIHRLQMDVAGIQKDVHQAERERKERRNTFASVEARLVQQRTDMQRQREVAERCGTALGELAGQIDGKAEALREAESSLGGLQERLQAATEEVAQARAAEDRIRERIDSLQARLKEMQGSVEESERDREERSRERESILEEREKAVLDREEAEVVVGDLARELENIGNELGDRNASRETMSGELARLTSEAQKALRDRNERDNALREIDLHCAELRAQVEYLETEAEDEFAQTIEEIIAELKQAEEADREWREKQEAEKAARRSRKAPGEADEEDAGQEAKTAAGGEEDSDEEDSDEEPEEDYTPATTPEDDEITDPAQLRQLVAELRQKLSRLGAVNEAAIEEYDQQKERLEFLTNQRDDMIGAKEQLEEAIEKIDETTTRLFNEALNNIRTNFKVMFQRLFSGGEADLVLVEDERYPEPGIDIYAQPPGKKIGGSITLMSGGEKALTAIALMFSLFQFKRSPICILDEIDAPLDDVNVTRMCDMLRDVARDTQFLVITHNKITMSLADTIYGVTMQEPGISKMVSVRFDEVEEQGLLEEQPVG